MTERIIVLALKGGSKKYVGGIPEDVKSLVYLDTETIAVISEKTPPKILTSDGLVDLPLHGWTIGEAFEAK